MYNFLKTKRLGQENGCHNYTCRNSAESINTTPTDVIYGNYHNNILIKHFANSCRISGSEGILCARCFRRHRSEERTGGFRLRHDSK